ncbi:hypothetical protein PIB30_013275 [Stylosanthes scabra]|uniref:BTB/POZ domain-containing protein n=1 Tax=Stylosanthes scabra TaxID=79078 RepID=A0ABU6S6X1_9FABA|nr:hypothetical protein [Stylosanthes scabra]
MRAAIAVAGERVRDRDGERGRIEEKGETFVVFTVVHHRGHRRLPPLPLPELLSFPTAVLPSPLVEERLMTKTPAVTFASRTLISDIPADLVIQINDITYLLHKFPLLPKCGLLQRLCYDSDSQNFSLEIHDIPRGEEAFELCAKFSYGISINISARNFVSALCAAKFLRMNDSIEKRNFVGKLEAFFNSCIPEGCHKA